LLPIADALATAHIKGIVHRDIKPENIYLAEDENGELQPKLVDFGVAKLENAEVDSKLTMRGTIVGSPGYLAPEQARGSDTADYRVDIWAFSVVLYELITGVPPFTGGNYNALLRSIVEDEPTPTVEHKAGDAELWSVLERGLRKDPQQRWPSMQEFGRALAHWAFSQGVDEDICGTGLEAKWLTGKTSGRASLISVNFEDMESPSAIRQRRRLRSDSPLVRSHATASTQAPPPLVPPPTTVLPPHAPLPSPAGLAGARMFADTELDSRPTPSNKKKAILLAAAAFGLLFMLGLVIAFNGTDDADVAAAEDTAAAPNAATVHTGAESSKESELDTREATAVEVSAPIAPPSPTSVQHAKVDLAPAESVATAQAPSGRRAATGSSGQRKAPRKEAEKALTKPQEAPKLDLKKPY
jgi:hypothetical protein